MSKLIDTNIAIFLADGVATVMERVAAFDDLPSISLVTLAELEGGVFVRAGETARRRERLDLLMTGLNVLPFERDVVAAYADIVSVLGFSRRRVLDRLIAATALVHDLTLVTANGPDFHDIPDLKLEVWSRPGQ